MASSLMLGEALKQLVTQYKNSVPFQQGKRVLRVLVIDAFLLYVFCTAALQFAYVCCVGTFPFNAFLAGFFSCMGVFVLTVSLRLQLNPNNRKDVVNHWEKVNPVKVFAEWLFCNLILQIAVVNFIG
eukprot:jgi/Galph1/4506/GphlegSOOS_G3208.1